MTTCDRCGSPLTRGEPQYDFIHYRCLTAAEKREARQARRDDLAWAADRDATDASLHRSLRREDFFVITGRV